MKMKFIFGLILMLLSCGQQSEQKELVTIESGINNDSIELSNRNNQKKKVFSPYEKELNKALSDTTINDYYKEIYWQEKLISADIDLMLSIHKNLFSENPDKDLFYFIVFTKSMNESDGFYSEALGVSSLEFVKTKTAVFADYFNVAPKLTDQDLDNWAQFIYWELQFSGDNQEKVIKELERQLLENIKMERKEYWVIIEQLIEKVREIE